MFEQARLDDREQEIYAAADEWWATRSLGRSGHDKLGPYTTAFDTVNAIMKFFQMEEARYPPPSYIASRPFSVYASSKKHGGSHVIVGNVYRDGIHRPTQREVSERVKEQKALAAKARKSSRRRNTQRTD